MYKLIGIREVDFKGSDGKQIEGFNLWLSYEDEHIDGVGVEKVFIPKSRVVEFTCMPDLGDEVEIRYNRYGKVADFVRA